MKRVSALVIAVAFLAASCGKKYKSSENVNLQQTWSYQTAEQFWFTPQGSELIPYQWFLVLEMPDSEHQFVEHDHMEKLRFITVEKKSALNTGGLPIGLAKGKSIDGVEVVGLTCAACHTGLMEIDDTLVQVEGAPGLVDLQTFETELVASLKATYESSEKFDRFAKKIGGDPKKLKEDLNTWYSRLNARATMNAPKMHMPGYGRIDALGHIVNDVAAIGLGIPENAREPDGPVSFPALWDTPQHDFVQWNGSVPNAGSGPLMRNIGEVLGVWGNLAFQPYVGKVPLPPVYPVSSADTDRLDMLEGMVTTLTSPLWPRNLAAINETGAAAGKVLFEQNCQGCHLPINRTLISRRVIAQMKPVAVVGTDPVVVNNFVSRKVKTGVLKGSQKFLNPKELFGDEAPAGEVLQNAVLGVRLANLRDGSPLRPIGLTTVRWDDGSVSPLRAFVGGIRADIRTQLNTFKTVSDAMLQKQIVIGYKARPLNGIWATAPYLHNGSVPSLWEMLQEPDKRPKKFYVGNRKFDADNVGYVSHVPYENGVNYFEFDTTVSGNSNSGHPFGTQLSPAQKRQLIEYMKTL